MEQYSLNWQVLLAIIVLIAFVAAIAKPLLALNKTLVTLDISVNGLREDFKTMKSDNKESHKEIYNKLDDHEGRITFIEKEK
jgi:hypothetical protein